MARRCRSKRRDMTYSSNCNVKHIVLNQIFNGNKDALINMLVDNMSITMYDGERGYIHMGQRINFDLTGYDEEKFYQRIQHSKMYFRKNRD